MRKILSLVLGLLWALPALAALPDGYTQLEYIESTGTQYIDTGVKDTSKVEMNMNVTAINNDYTLLYGSQKTGTVVRRVVSLGNESHAFSVNVGSNSSASTINTGSAITLNTFHNLTFILGTTAQIIEDGVTYTASNSGDNASTGLNDYLFCYNYAGSPNYKIKAKISYAKIYGANGTLVRNFIPAKNSSGVVGMYDTVSGTFFTNQGTGEFIAGPDACDGTVVNYVSATGTGVQNGTPTPTNPIEPTFYKQGNMVLRKVGDYADSYDATTGKITRRVGVKVFDGTEEFTYASSSNVINSAIFTDRRLGKDQMVSTHFAYSTDNTVNIQYDKFSGASTTNNVFFKKQDITSVESWKQYLAEQYAAGTPVTVWYPLAEETTEDWTESQYCNANEPIKIATTKYNESAFSPLNTALANAISVVDTVVSNTITQAGRIATLQAQKQTRPNDIADDNEKCPAGKKCLLVEDASGVPHWYEIVTGRLPDGYTELEYIESTGTQWIDTGIAPSEANNIYIRFKNTTTNVGYLIGATNGNNRYNYVGIHNAFQGYGENWGGGSDYKAFNIPADTTTIHTIEIDLRNIPQFYFDSVLKATQSPYETINSTNNLIINANVLGTQNRCSAQYYEVKLSNNGTLIRDFVPALNPDGKIGMYDLVGGRFYENAGTGTFIGGQPVFN